MMSVSQKKIKLKELHSIENEVNKNMGRVVKEIQHCKNRIVILEAEKKKLAKRVSHNMRFRRDLLNEIVKEKQNGKKIKD